MIQIEYKGKKYTGPEPGAWDQLTIGKGIKLAEVCKVMPIKLRKLYNTFVTDDATERAKVLSEMTDADDMHVNPTWMAKVISVMYSLDEPMDVTLGNYADVEAFYRKYCLSFVMGIVHLPTDYQPKELIEFRFRGQRYLMPKPFKTLKEEIPLGHASADQMSEALDLLTLSAQMQEGKLELMPILVASLCLPDGEHYDASTVMERSKGFHELPMAIGLEVFFYCINFYIDAQLHGLRSDTVEEAKPPSLAEALRGLAGAVRSSMPSGHIKMITKN